MSQSDQSVWAYHRSNLKADSLVIAAAVAGLGLVSFAAASLHRVNAPATMVAQSCGIGIVLLLTISMCGRELLRRRGLSKGEPLASRFPKTAVIATFLGSLFLTTAFTRTHLETGIAVFQGRQLLEAGEYQAAADCFERVIELAPNQSKGYCLRGLAQFRAGNTQAAYDDLQLALKLQPEDKTAQAVFMATLDRMSEVAEPESEDEMKN